MIIKILGAHNCESKKTGCLSLLIDREIAIDAGVLAERLTFKDMLRLKAVLLTHQHYDHIRDIPALGMSLFLQRASVDIYCLPPVFEALSQHLLNGTIYPRFYERPTDRPTLKFNILQAYEVRKVNGYSIMSAPFIHSVPVNGYQVISPEGKTLLYTGDVGPGLAQFWDKVSPQLLMIEVTASNRFDAFGRDSLHLTPNLLGEEMKIFRKLKGYLPRIVAVHMSPFVEREIEPELEALADTLGTEITIASEGMEIEL